MGINKDVSNLPLNLYETSFYLMKQSNLFNITDGEIDSLKSDLLNRKSQENTASLITLSVAVEYLLKAFLLKRGQNIFKKFDSSEKIDLGNGATFLKVIAKKDNRLEQMLDSKNIERMDQIDTQSFSKILNRIDQLKMEQVEKDDFKNGLFKFKERIRNKYVHTFDGVIQISPKHFNNLYIPAINLMLLELYNKYN